MLAQDFAIAGPLRPLKRAEYDQLVDSGVFDGERLELLAGVLVTMSPQGAPHSWVITLLARTLDRALEGRAQVRVRMPFALSEESEPEPDIAVVAEQNWSREHPDRAFLLVEVACSSRAIDRAKASLYAQGGVPEYWLVDVDAATVEIYSQPIGGRYGKLVTHGRGAVIAPDAFPDVAVAIAAILP